MANENNDAPLITPVEEPKMSTVGTIAKATLAAGATAVAAGAIATGVQAASAYFGGAGAATSGAVAVPAATGLGSIAAGLAPASEATTSWTTLVTDPSNYVRGAALGGGIAGATSSIVGSFTENEYKRALAAAAEPMFPSKA